MLNDNEKKNLRELKREMKRVGKRKVRNYLKQQLRDNPEEAQHNEPDFGKWSTEHMNGKFTDSKRQKGTDERTDNPPTGDGQSHPD